MSDSKGTASITIERYDELKEIERVYKKEIADLTQKNAEDYSGFLKHIVMFCVTLDRNNNHFYQEIQNAAKQAGFTIIVEDASGSMMKIGDGTGKVYKFDKNTL